MTSLNSPKVYGHRGAMGYCVENTIPCFKKAVEMGAGVETDVQLTKDNVLVCFHDYYLKIKSQSHQIKNMTFEDLLKIKFKDKRKIPTVDDLFTIFAQNKDLLFSFDIRDKNSGFELIRLAKSFVKLEKITITDMRLTVLNSIRDHSEEVKLVHTIPTWIVRVNHLSVNFEKIKELKVEAINIRIGRRAEENFQNIINNDLKCYIWGVNSKSQMKDTLDLKFNDEIVSAIYTDYPDALIKLINKRSY